jgi:cytidyltransferase-like protein
MIADYKNLGKIRDDHADKKIVFSDGTFDILHLGHLTHLNKVITYGDIVVIGVMSDDWVKMRKGESRPIMNQEERSLIVDSIKGVDYVVMLFDFQKKERIRTTDALKALRPDVFITADLIWKNQISILNEFGVRLEIVERKPPTLVKTCVEPISTTNVIERIADLYKKN